MLTQFLLTLNAAEQFKSFIYGSIRIMLVGGVKALIFDH